MTSTILSQTWVQMIDTPLPQALTNGTLHVSPGLSLPGPQRLVHVGGTSAGAATGIPEVYTAQIQGDGNLAPWKIAGELPKAMAFHGAAMVGEWLYLLNGTSVAPVTPLYAVRLDNEGNFIGAPTDVGSMDAGLSSPAVVVDGQWMYVIGGDDAAAFVIANPNLTRVGTVVTATIAAGHNLVPGQTVTLAPGEANFAAGVKTITAVTASTFSYSEAGAAASSTVPETFTAIANPRIRSVRLNGDGTIGNWRLHEQVLPAQNYFAAAVVWDSFIYLIGGTDNLAAGAQSSIYSARIQGNGQLGLFTKIADLPVAVSKHAAVIWRDKLIIMGGQDASAANHAEMWIASLQPSGQLGAITTEALALPVALRNVRCVSDGKRLWLTSGFSTVRIADVYSLRLE